MIFYFNSLREKAHHILQHNKTSKLIYGLIVFNVILTILETDKALNEKYSTLFQIVESVSVFIFTLEYIIRLWTSDFHESTRQILRSKKLGYIFSAYGIIDLIAILPFYLPLLLPNDLRVVRILRLFRLLRILKLGRYSKSIKIIKSVLRETRPQLAITIFATWILLVLSSTLMFYAENNAQPDKFSSIGDSLWWAIATLTTVGYGDVYPITPIGKILSAIIALIGIGFIALPTGILSSAFIENAQKKESFKCQKCANCRQELENITKDKYENNNVN